jgi:hypothetical protein
MRINGIDTADVAKINGVLYEDIFKFNGIEVLQGFPIITNGLQLYLDAFNTDSYPGTGTTWYDLTSNFYNFTNEGGTFTNSSGIKFFSLDGVNDRIIGNSNTTLFDNDNDGNGWTWSMWVNHSASPAFLDVLVNTTYTSDKVSYYLDNRNSLGTTGAGFTAGIYKGDPNNYNVKTSYNLTVSTNVWRHVCATFEVASSSTGTLKMYTNGVLRTTTSVSTSAGYTWEDSNTSRKPVIGAFFTEATSAYSRFNAIRVGEVLQYNIALDADEVLHNYNNTKANYGL